MYGPIKSILLQSSQIQRDPGKGSVAAEYQAFYGNKYRTTQTHINI